MFPKKLVSKRACIIFIGLSGLTLPFGSARAQDPAPGPALGAPEEGSPAPTAPIPSDAPPPPAPLTGEAPAAPGSEVDLSGAPAPAPVPAEATAATPPQPAEPAKTQSAEQAAPNPALSGENPPVPAEETAATPSETPSPPPPAVAETPPAPAAPEGRSTKATASFRKNRPYDDERPWFGVQIAGSLKALGSSDPFSGGAGASASAVSVYAEFLPVPIQDLGVISLGPSAALYPVSANDQGERRTSGPFSVWSVGGQVRYQFRYFRNQPVVPMVGVAIESLHYSVVATQARTDTTSGSLLTTGPVAGLWVLLNLLEPSSANELYLNTGILRTYLVTEFRNMDGSDDQLIVGGTSFYFGLRFEL